MSYKAAIKILVACVFAAFTGFVPAAMAQELFPLAEAASTVPRHAVGVRLLSEAYTESGLLRTAPGLRVMYGLTARLSVYATGTLSNIHEKTLPFDFISHNHSGGQLVAGTNTPQAGIPYPYVFNSVDVYAKYRFYSRDGENRHLRLAAYGELSYVAVPSHEAEPDLLVHTSGGGGGLIVTYLLHRFAASATAGFILPLAYKGDTYDKYGGVYPTEIKYGNAGAYSLSLGYLLLPRSYKSYAQTNLNLYIEFAGRAYGAARVTEHDGPFAGAVVYNVPVTTPILASGAYLDAYPGVQLIAGSVWRIDASVGVPLIGRSYNHLYPLYLVGVQRYFYL